MLHACAHTEAVDDLVADPLLVPCVDFPGGDQADADGHQDRGEDHPGGVVAEDGDEDAGDDGDDDEAEDHGEVADAAFDSGGALDRLEPDGDEVDEDEEGGAEAGAEPGCEGDAALLHDSGGDGGVVLLPELDANEGDDEDAEDNEKRDDPPIAPWILGSSPLECQKKTDNRRDEQTCANWIELFGAFEEPNGLLRLPRG